MSMFELKKKLTKQINDLNDIFILESLEKFLDTKIHFVHNETTENQNKEEIKIVKDNSLNRVSFFKKGVQIIPVKRNGNLVEFSDGQILLV
jgi:hypothetical protein